MGMMQHPFDLLPWQREILAAALNDEPPQFLVSRRSWGKHAAAVALCALWEARTERWDVAGTGEPACRVRREARELAATLYQYLDAYE